jgi:hypothetical protein
MAAAGVVIWSGSAWADTAEQSREGPRGCRGLLEGWTGGGQGHGDLSARRAARNLAVGLWRWWVPPRSPAPTTLAFTATSSRCRSSQDTGRERAHLARSYQRLERLQGLLDGDRGVGRVQLVEVDHIGAEPTQAGVAGGVDAVRRQARAAEVGDLEAHLRSHDDLGSVMREPRRQHALRAAVLVDVGRVDEVAAARPVAVEDPLGLVRGRSCRPSAWHRAPGG